MNKLLALPVLAFGVAILGGCQDQSGEIEKLRGEQAAQQKRFDEAHNEWTSDRDKMQAEINELKAALGTLEGEGDLPPGSMAEQIKALKTRIAEAEASGDEDIAEELASLKADLKRVEEQAGAAAAGVDSEQLDEAIAAAVERKLDERGIEEPMPKTKNLKEVMSRLDISEGEKQQIEQYIVDAKQATLETLEIPTEDGRVFAEELIDTFIKVQNGDGKMTDIHVLYLELSQKKIPGDIEGRTYGEALEAIKQRNREDISRMLSEEDQRKLTAAHEDWSDFDVENDPFGELYMERLQKAEEESGE